MASPTKILNQPVEESPKASENVSSYVPREVAECIHEDATKDERSESFIISKILQRHYAARVAAKKKATQHQHRRAA